MTLVDTSVAVPLVLASHEHHASITAAVGGRPVQLAHHAQLESYAVLTRLPGDARLSAADAAILLVERFGAPVMLKAAAAKNLLAQLSAVGVVGGAVYDAVIGITARDADALLLDPRPHSRPDAPSTQRAIRTDLNLTAARGGAIHSCRGRRSSRWAIFR